MNELTINSVHTGERWMGKLQVTRYMGTFPFYFFF